MNTLQHTCVICNPNESTQYNFVDCTKTTTAGPRDEHCTCCLMPFDDDDKDLLRHDNCQRTWHESCIKQWVKSSLSSFFNTDFVACPLCRGNIYNYPGETKVTTADENTLARLQELLVHNTPIYAVDKQELMDILCLACEQDGSFALFIKEKMFPEDGPVFAGEHSFSGDSGYQLLPPGRPIAGGVFCVEFCDHQKEYLCCTAQQMQEILSSLHRSNWDYQTGLVQPRVRVTSHSTIDSIVAAAQALDADEVIVDPIQMASLVPSSGPIERNVALAIRVTRTTNEDGSQLHHRIQVFGVSSPGPQGFQVWDNVSVERRRAIVQQLGGTLDGLEFPESSRQLFVRISIWHNMFDDSLRTTA